MAGTRNNCNTWQLGVGDLALSWIKSVYIYISTPPPASSINLETENKTTWESGPGNRSLVNGCLETPNVQLACFQHFLRITKCLLKDSPAQIYDNINIYLKRASGWFYSKTNQQMSPTSKWPLWKSTIQFTPLYAFLHPNCRRKLCVPQILKCIKENIYL